MPIFRAHSGLDVCMVHPASSFIVCPSAGVVGNSLNACILYVSQVVSSILWLACLDLSEAYWEFPFLPEFWVGFVWGAFGGVGNGFLLFFSSLQVESVIRMILTAFRLWHTISTSCIITGLVVVGSSLLL